MRQYLMVTLGDESKSPHDCIDTRRTTHAKNDFFTRKFHGYVFKIGQKLCIHTTHNLVAHRSLTKTLFFISNTLNSLPSLFFSFHYVTNLYTTALPAYQTIILRIIDQPT